MKKRTKIIGITFFIIVDLFIVGMVSPTLGRQVQFREGVWKQHPARKVRYYMSDSLLEQLKADRPTREATVAMLGEPDWFYASENHLSYWLRSPGLMGLAVYHLEIDFTDDGTFNNAAVVYSD